MRYPLQGFVLCATGLVALVTFRGVAEANDVYLAATSAGSANGTNCTNPYAYSYFNAFGNWSSTPTGTKIGPGATVHLCAGTYTFVGGATNGLTFQLSGVSGHPIILAADQGPVTFTAPYWGHASGGSVGAINTSGVSYITINGYSQLILQASANGTLLANQVDWGEGVVATGGSNVTVENLTVSNIYVSVCTLPITNCTDINGQDTGGIAATGNNMLVTGNSIHDAKVCLGANWNGTITNETYSNNIIYNCDHGIEVGAAGINAVLTNLIVSGNDISNMQNWDNEMNYNHHDAIHEFAYNLGDVVNGYLVYNNYIHGDFGQSFNAGIFQESSTNTIGTFVFNNLIVDSSTAQHLGCGLICLENVGAAVYNNTLVNATAFGTPGINLYYQGDIVENNTLSNMASAVGLVSPATVANTTFDYNNYYGIGANGWNHQGAFAGWQSTCYCDSHSTNSNPNLSVNYTPIAASAPLILTGTNLSQLSIPALNIDKAGIARPPSPANWSIGAYQYQSGSMPYAPTNLSAIPH